MKKLRKFLVASVMVLTTMMFAGMLSFVPTSANAAAASAGDLIKMNGLSSVYYLGANGKRYVFPNSTTYFSWYPDFSGVVTIPASELQSYPLGGNVTMRPGTKLVKITTDPSVYAVSPDGVLHKIGSEAQAAALYGTDWAKRVVDVPDAFFTNYTIGAPLASGAVPAGSLVKNAGSANVYYYDGSSYSLVPSEMIARSNHLNLADAITVSTAITASGSAVASGQLANVAQNGKTNGNVATGSGLMVSLNANSAGSTTLIATQAAANLASFNFTAANDGAVTVKSVRIHRIGISSDSYLTNVYLYEGNNKITDAGSVSNGYVTFSNSNGLFIVSAGQTKTISVKADISSGATGGNIGVAINAASDVVTTASSVSGSFPETGNLMSLTSTPLDLAGAIFQAITIPSAAGTDTINAGTMNATVWSAPLQISKKAVQLKYVSFRQVGSINSDALQNIKLYVNGVQAGNASSINANNRVIFDLSANPVTLQTGTATIELRADIVKGSSRTYSFNLQLASDIILTDTNYNINISPANKTGLAANTAPIGTVGSTLISSGSISTSADPSFTTNQVVKNASNIVLAQYTMKAYGEAMQVNTVVIDPSLVTQAGSGDGTEGINNLALYVDGSQVGSSKNYNYTVTSGTAGVMPVNPSFGTNNLFTIPAGETVTLQVKGDLNQLSSSTLKSVHANVVSLAAQGVSSVTSYSGGTVPANQTLAIVSGNLTVAKDTSFGDQKVVQNTAKQKIGSFILQTGSAEGVRITSIGVKMVGTAALSSLSNLYVSDNTTPIQPQTNNNFTTNITIPANSSHVVNVYADLGAMSNGTTTQVALSVNATGATTNSVTLANSNGTVINGQTLTVTTGTLTAPTLVSNFVPSGYVKGGLTQNIAEYNIVSQDVPASISELWFYATSSVAANTDITSVTVGNSSAPVVNGVAHITGLNLAVPAGLQGLNIPVKATFASVTSAGQGGVSLGDVARLNLFDYKYVTGSQTLYGAASGSGVYSSGGVFSNNMILAASVPTVALAADNTAGQSTGYTGSAASELMRFTVANNGANSINLHQITVTPIYSSGAIASTTTQWIKIYNVNDLNTVLASSTIGVSGTANNIAFTNDSVISGNSSNEYVVKVDTQGTYSTTGTSIQLQLTAVSDTAVGTGTAWQWNDSTTASYMNGYLVKNLPLTGNLFVH